MINIREAKVEDLKGITEIYNEAVLNTTATFDTEAKTIENRKDWLLNRDARFKVFVAESNNEIVGFASLNRWSERKAYDITAEISVYIHSAHRGRGIGGNMIDVIMQAAQEEKFRSVIARISAGNDKSVYLHKMAGFEVVGVLKECGKKFDQLIDVTIMQKMIPQ